MKITLTPQESEQIFYNSLCNALGTGYIEGYGLEIDCDRSQYKDSREHLLRQGKDTCYEDILMQVLRDGGSLTIIDHDGGEYTRTITLKDVHERVGETDHQSLINFSLEQDDVFDADMVIQTVFFQEVIFG